MRKYTKILLLIIIFSLVATFFTACGNKTRNEILGKWEVVSFEKNPDTPKNMFTELQAMAAKMVFAEGTVVEFIDGEKVSLRNVVTEYSWVTEDKVQLGNEKNDETPLIFDVEIKDGTMIFKGDMIITFVKSDGKARKDNKNALDDNKKNDGLLKQIDSLTNERDELEKQKAELESKVQELEAELKKYQEVVHKREFLTQDSEIEEKFALAYSLDETATIHELEITLSNVTFSDNYNGVVPEFGKVITGTMNIKNISRENAYLNFYHMYVVDNEGCKFQKSLFNERKNEIYEPVNTAINSIDLKPKFSTSEDFLFVVPDIDTELLLEIYYSNGNNKEVKYIRLK